MSSLPGAGAHGADAASPSVRAPHGLRRVVGRDPSEKHRTATPLELLFDLVFVVAFAQAGEGFSHEILHHNSLEGGIAFGVAIFAIVWAWVGYTWFSSGFDTDDWLHRLLTMVQMAGVVVLALGIAPFFQSLGGSHVDNTLMVAGYIVMRAGLIAQWLRVYVSTPHHRRRALTVIMWTALAQVGWTALMIAHTTWGVFFGVGIVLVVFELLGQFLPGGSQSAPWHPHHLAERFSLMAIITLGEAVVGTIATLQAVIPEDSGWTDQGVLLVIAGLGITFGLWWSYFSVDFGRALHAARRKAGLFTLIHVVLLGALVAVGSGLHVAGAALENPHEADGALAVTFVAAPIVVFYLSLFGLYTYFVPEADLRHAVLIVLTLTCLAAAYVMAQAGVSMGWCLLVAAAATLPTVIGYEWFGHRHQHQQLEALELRSQ